MTQTEKAARSTQLHPFYTYIILRDYSSKENPMNAKEVARKMRLRFFEQETREQLKDGAAIQKPYELNRQTIYKHFNLLDEITDKYSEYISFKFTRNDNGTVYIEPLFEKGEAYLLSDAVATSRFIDKTKSTELIQLLGNLANLNLLSLYKPRLEFKNNSDKAYNDEIFNNVTFLAEAIQKGVKVTLNYMKYDLNKKLVPISEKNAGFRKIRPYYLIWSLNKYYVMYLYDDSTEPRFMRVDKMKNIEMTNEKVGTLKSISNLSDYTRNQVFMFGGKPEWISFRCKMDIIGQVIDFFGEDVKLRQAGDEHFTVEIYTSKASIRYWLMQYSSSVDRIKPAELREDVIAMLEDALARNRADN